MEYGIMRMRPHIWVNGTWNMEYGIMGTSKDMKHGRMESWELDHKFWWREHGTWIMGIRPQVLVNRTWKYKIMGIRPQICVNKNMEHGSMESWEWHLHNISGVMANDEISVSLQILWLWTDLSTQVVVVTFELLIHRMQEVLNTTDSHERVKCKILAEWKS